VFQLRQIAHVGVSVSSDLELFGREIIFEVFQTVKNIPERYGRRDRQTDGPTDDMQSQNRALRSIAR